MSDKCFLDTNVLVYAHDTEHPAKREAAQELLWSALRGANGVISAQVLSEFFVTITRKVAKPLPAARAREEIELLSNLEVVDTDATLVLRGIDASQRWKISYWDGLILAAAERGGCRTLSEDLADGQAYGPVTVRNPFRPR